jgi:hypothetical protein
MSQTDEISQNYCVSGLCPSSRILNTRKYNGLENGSVSMSDEGRKIPTLLGPLERTNLNH